MFLFAIALFALVGTSLLLMGLVYLSVNEFMPYHSAAAQMSWQELGPGFQGLLLGFLKGLGGGAFVAGVAILFMLFMSLRKGPAPYVPLLSLVATAYSTLLCYATFSVYTSTQGKPPLALTVALVVMSVAASIALVLSQRNSEGH